MRMKITIGTEITAKFTVTKKLTIVKIAKMRIALEAMAITKRRV